MVNIACGNIRSIYGYYNYSKKKEKNETTILHWVGDGRGEEEEGGEVLLKTLAPLFLSKTLTQLDSGWFYSTCCCSCTLCESSVVSLAYVNGPLHYNCTNPVIVKCQSKMKTVD